jgi:hypothetical protein
VCIPPPPEAGRQRSCESEWLRRNGGSEGPAFCSGCERLLWLKVSPLSNHPERRRRTRRWGASPPMRERRKDPSKMRRARAPLQPRQLYWAAVRLYRPAHHFCRLRNSESERRDSSGVALDRHLTPVRLRELLDDGEPAPLFKLHERHATGGVGCVPLLDRANRGVITASAQVPAAAQAGWSDAQRHATHPSASPRCR